MHYQELEPSAELRDLVHRIWLLRGPAGTGPGAFQRAMPDGRAELIFNLGDPFECRGRDGIRAQPRTLLVGPSRRAMEIRPTGLVDLVGVRFRPEAASAWLRVGGSELLDRAYAAGDLPVPLAPTLAEQLAGEPGAGSRVALLRRELARGRGRWGFDPRLGAAVDLLLGDGRARPDAIARAVGMSYRQMSRRFKERLGFGPKPLVRLGRFQRVLRALDGRGRHPIAAVAVRAGYFDQAHLARDFRLFAGVAPARYLREARELARNFIADAEPAGEFFQDLADPR
ncbi:MAG TPA: helix-turn-helix domain-containing protein [Gemmatimonadales bacterium]|nr:helix-turn-helix domain-containing protein [Gemmatimonadales bacterium]